MLPVGTVLVPTPTLVRRDGGRLLHGGSPRRLLRLTDVGAALVAALLAGEPARTGQERALGRRLVDAGLARSYPPAGERPSVTVLVPVRDRATALGRCLDALGDRDPVLVVDDGSLIPVDADRPHVTVLRRDTPGGPAAARSDGVGRIDADVVVCLDSDVVVGPGWLEPLLAHLADPQVAAAAPRVVPAPAGTVLGRYLRARSPLDLGPDDLPVRPGSTVPYVPTAALVIRRELADFDPTLRYGEDVDLVWRLVAAGHDVRYDPRVTVAHTEPVSWRRALARRHAYGTAAGPLARRHPGRLAPLRLAPLPLVAAIAATLAPAPLAAGAVAISAVTTARRLRAAGLPARDAATLAAATTGHALLGLGRYAAALAPLPTLLAARRRPRLAALLLAPAACDWLRGRPPLDPVRFAAAWLADEAAYGSGVWRGALRARTVGPVRPDLGTARPGFLRMLGRSAG